MFSKIAIPLSCLILLASCQEKSAKPEPVSKPKIGFTKRGDLDTAEDGIVRLKGSNQPFTGPVVMSKDRNVGYFASYVNGKLHGPELRYYSDGTKLRRWYDWVNGEKVRSREFYENGQLQRDAMMKNGEAYGMHRTWAEDGLLRFDGNFTDNLQWHGHVRDLDENGNVLWDADFIKGAYIRGIYPEEAEAGLIKRGLIDPVTKKPVKP